MIHFVITIVFDFSWDDCYTQEKLEIMIIQNLGGGGWGGGGRCITVDVKMVISFGMEIIPSRSFASLAHASKQPIKKQEIITSMHSVVRKIQI